MNSTVGISGSDTATGRVAAVAVEVDDPELDSDVRAVLAALAVDTVSPADPAADLLLTDRADVGRGSRGGERAGEADMPAVGGGLPVVRVAPDRARGDDDNDGVVHLPSGSGDLVALLVAPRPGRSGSQVTVLGAVGGCGATTLAAAIAVRSAGSRRTLLVETDPRGTGVDLVLGVEAEPGLRVEDVRADLGVPDPEALWEAVPRTRAGLGVLARSRDRDATPTGAPARDGGPGAIRSHRAAGGLVVSDAGTFGEGPRAAAGADVVVVVTRADLQGAVAAGRALRQFPDAVLVVRTGRGDPLHAADVAGAAPARQWYVLPEVRGVRRASGSGGLADALDRGRSGGVRRLAAVADALVEGAAPDARR